MRRVEITARSLAEAAALEALSDVASAVDDWDGVRIVGGQMVHIHTMYLHGPYVVGRSTTTRRRLVQQVVSCDPRPHPFPNL